MLPVSLQKLNSHRMASLLRSGIDRTKSSENGVPVIMEELGSSSILLITTQVGGAAATCASINFDDGEEKRLTALLTENNTQRMWSHYFPEWSDGLEASLKL